MKIGDKLILHKTDFPQHATKDPDVFVAVEIVEVKKVPNCFGKGFGDGLKARDAQGNEYTCCWEHFPDDSMSPYWMWWLVAKKEIWYDVAYVSHLATLPKKPIWLERKELAAIMDFCEKHGEIFYKNNGWNGCFKCHCGQYNPKEEKVDKPIEWNGWF